MATAVLANENNMQDVFIAGPVRSTANDCKPVKHQATCNNLSIDAYRTVYYTRMKDCSATRNVQISRRNAWVPTVSTGIFKRQNILMHLQLRGESFFYIWFRFKLIAFRHGWTRETEYNCTLATVSFSIINYGRNVDCIDKCSLSIGSLLIPRRHRGMTMLQPCWSVTIYAMRNVSIDLYWLDHHRRFTWTSNAWPIYKRRFWTQTQHETISYSSKSRFSMRIDNGRMPDYFW